MRDSKPIMLVEDDTVDAMTVKRALKDLKVLNPLIRTGNGEEALVYLRDDNNVKPCVILLDLNMPKMNGIEFLRVAKADEKLRRIPAIILTTSKDDQDRIQTFQLNVAGFIVKPVDYKKFVDAVRIINLYWTLSELPNSEQESTNANIQTDTACRR
ncbi:MAG: response regulator [Sedimentisphaerales bacterium]|nr:response regulator [Sedimentisphaerales bacterium]